LFFGSGILIFDGADKLLIGVFAIYN